MPKAPLASTTETTPVASCPPGLHVMTTYFDTVLRRSLRSLHGYGALACRRLLSSLLSGCDYTEKKAQGGDSEAQFKMGLRYWNSPPDPTGNKEMQKWFRKAAEQGHAKAQCRLADSYNTAFGDNAVDHAEAFKWYRKSAEQGDSEAQCNLGYMFENGQGTSNSIPDAWKWYSASANQNYGRAQCELGKLYERGKGVAQNMSQARTHYRAAADLGDESGLRSWLDCYMDLYDPNKVEFKSPAGAIANWRKRAANGDAHAEYYLGMLYSWGDGVPTDFVEGARWLLSAAAKGSMIARLRLAEMCETGKGMPLDRIEAYKWYNLTPVNSGLEGRARLTKVLTPGEIAEGQRRSTAYSGGTTNAGTRER